MTVYVDPIVVREIQNVEIRRRGVRWSHMIADTHDELMDMANRLTLNPRWIQREGTAHEHFDLTPSRRAHAVRLGAVELTFREMAHKIIEKQNAFGTFGNSRGEASNGFEGMTKS